MAVNGSGVSTPDGAARVTRTAHQGWERGHGQLPNLERPKGEWGGAAQPKAWGSARSRDELEYRQERVFVASSPARGCSCHSDEAMAHDAGRYAQVTCMQLCREAVGGVAHAVVQCTSLLPRAEWKARPSNAPPPYPRPSVARRRSKTSRVQLHSLVTCTLCREAVGVAASGALHGTMVVGVGHDPASLPSMPSHARAVNAAAGGTRSQTRDGGRCAGGKGAPQEEAVGWFGSQNLLNSFNCMCS